MNLQKLYLILRLDEKVFWDTIFMALQFETYDSAFFHRDSSRELNLQAPRHPLYAMACTSGMVLVVYHLGQNWEKIVSQTTCLCSVAQLRNSVYHINIKLSSLNCYWVFFSIHGANLVNRYFFSVCMNVHKKTWYKKNQRN